MKKIFGLFLGLLAGSYTEAQLTPLQKREAIDSVLKIINSRYVFPEIGQKMEAYIRQQQQKKVYDTFTDGNRFAQKLTQDLRTICRDKHVNVHYSAEAIAYEPERDLMSIPDNEKENYGNMLKRENYGIRKLDIIKGSIGYLDLDFLCDPAYAGDTYAAAMNYLAHTESLIIDLRKCRGSMSPDAIPFLCSYFFESPVHLNDFYWRKGDRYVQSWTYSYVPGKKFLNKPVYVLTSSATFSGAEELAYDLKNLKRAVVIGQPTGGGANPGGSLRVSEHFRMFIPVGRAINPVTKTNWEGAGVQPDTLANTRLALHKAQTLALQNSIATAKETAWKEMLQGWLKELERNKPVFKTVMFELKGYEQAKEVYVTGSFNDWSPQEIRLQRKGDGWVGSAEAETGKISYKFVVDGRYITDPANPETETEGEYVNSVRVVR